MKVQDKIAEEVGNVVVAALKLITLEAGARYDAALSIMCGSDGEVRIERNEVLKREQVAGTIKRTGEMNMRDGCTHRVTGDGPDQFVQGVNRRMHRHARQRAHAGRQSV